MADIHEEAAQLSLKARLAMADGRAMQRPLRRIAPASPYAPIRQRALGPRDNLPKDASP